ncbi:MAG TPA: hypothetical protein VNO21_06080, partial [Polyangiaceae bacterium]|nr:hypothetical protein [Polyangiaceae bacterium]
RIFQRVGRALVGAGRFILRAWLLIAMVSYAILFVAIVIGLTFARQGGDNRSGGWGVHVLGGLFRAVADALFWTFHPFSPLRIDSAYGYNSYGYGSQDMRRRRKPADDVPFYEKINRFVFGPPVPVPDQHAARARILEEIRAQKGRIGLADVMRVTGLPRDRADPLMARLMLDHEGTVEVGEQGGILYRFEALRRTAEGEVVDDVVVPSPAAKRPGAAWETPKKLPPLTGNPGDSNTMIAMLNGFNLLASGMMIANGLTLSNLGLLFSRYTEPHHRGRLAPLILPDDGVPVVFGVIPLVFSLAIFAMPLVRAFLRTREKKNVAQENARLGILREVLARTSQKAPVPDEALRKAYRVATGEEPTSKQITARVVELGGDVDIGSEGEIRYRFADLEAEAEALDEERAHASEREARLGRVVFASDE